MLSPLARNQRPRRVLKTDWPSGEQKKGSESKITRAKMGHDGAWSALRREAENPPLGEKVDKITAAPRFSSTTTAPPSHIIHHLSQWASRRRLFPLVTASPSPIRVTMSLSTTLAVCMTPARLTTTSWATSMCCLSSPTLSRQNH